MTNPTLLSDVEQRFRPLPANPERARAQAWLDDVWTEACARATGLEARVDARQVSTSLVIRVVAGATARLLHNPERLRRFNADDVGYEPDSAPGGGMYLTADEVDLLTGPMVDGFTGSWRYS